MKQDAYSENEEKLLEIKTMIVKIISLESFEGKIEETSQKVRKRQKGNRRKSVRKLEE